MSISASPFCCRVTMNDKRNNDQTNAVFFFFQTLPEQAMVNRASHADKHNTHPQAYAPIATPEVYTHTTNESPRKISPDLKQCCWKEMIAKLRKTLQARREGKKKKRHLVALVDVDNHGRHRHVPRDFERHVQHFGWTRLAGEQALQSARREIYHQGAQLREKATRVGGEGILSPG